MGVVSIYELVAKSHEALGCPQAPNLNMATQLLAIYYQKVLYNLVFFPKVYLSVFQVPFPSLADFISVTSAYFPPLASRGFIAELSGLVSHGSGPH